MTNANMRSVSDIYKHQCLVVSSMTENYELFGFEFNLTTKSVNHGIKLECIRK